VGYFKDQSTGGSNRNRAFSKSWEGPFDIEIKEDGITDRYMRGSDAQAVDDFNKKIMEWGTKVKTSLGPSISSFDIKGNRLNKSIRNTYYYEFGEIFRLGFAFAREGIFVHKGVSRGYVMRGGTVAKTSKTVGFNRIPKPWFNPVIEQHVPELQQIIHDYAENAILNTVRIYIR